MEGPDCAIRGKLGAQAHSMAGASAHTTYICGNALEGTRRAVNSAGHSFRRAEPMAEPALRVWDRLHYRSQHSSGTRHKMYHDALALRQTTLLSATVT